MGARQRLIMVALTVCALICVLPTPALASDTQSAMMIDDNQLIYSSSSHTADVMRQLRALGVDQVKVSVVWSLVAPDALGSKRPSFDASDPAAYPSGAWSRYDLIVKQASKLGMGVYFMLQGPVPVWARAAGPVQGPILSRAPVRSEWSQFVTAVGRRYSGSYVVGGKSADPGNPAPPSLLGIPLGLGGSGSAAKSAPAPIPRVSYWEIWNEPNEKSWLSPWYRRQRRRKLYTQPALYRGLVDTAWSALMSTGHAGDTILIGETANVGRLDPIPFARAMYCVGSSDLPLRGRAAAALGCPTSGTPASFLAAHPGLFDATGYAHHPYAFDVAPNRPYPRRNYVTLQNLPTLERVLGRIYSAYGHPAPGGVPLYLTEWGYESDPPNPFVHTSLGQQETWLNQGEFMSWQYPWVRALAQFELVDDGPKPNTTSGSRLYWSTFQTGLEYANGARKPAYNAYQVPIWLPRAHPGPSVTVWGQLRPADHTTIQYGLVQFARGHSSDYNTLSEVSTTSSEGFLVTHVAIPAAGSLRLAWLNSGTGGVEYSRTVQIS
jgi:hypothetical protein